MSVHHSGLVVDVTFWATWVTLLLVVPWLLRRNHQPNDPVGNAEQDNDLDLDSLR